MNEGFDMAEVARPAEAGPALCPPRVLTSDRVLAAEDAAYARTLERVRAASEHKPEFVPLAEQMRELRRELSAARKENRRLKLEVANQRNSRSPWLDRAVRKSGKFRQNDYGTK